MAGLLDNIIWHALSGPQGKFSTGTERARRFAPGFSPILGFADVAQPAFDDLLPFCSPDEHFYCGDWAGPMPAGWKLEEESTMFRMVWSGEPPAQVLRRIVEQRPCDVSPSLWNEVLELTEARPP